MSTVPNLSAEPLPLDQVPGPLKKHCDSKAPPPLRDMGAKGLVPGIEPHNLVLVLFQLQFDPIDNIRETAINTFAELPDEIAVAAARAELPGPVLDYCARNWLGFPNRVELLLANPATADQTFAFVAGKGDERLAGIIADNQVRFLRTPLIIEQLYLNPNTAQSAIDRVLELAQREQVDLHGLPGLAHAIKATESLTQPKQGAPGDNEFQDYLKYSVKLGEWEEEHGRAAADIEKDFEEEEEKFVSRQVRIQQMSISQKVRLATLGSKEDRSILIRDGNRLVHMAAINSPKIQYKDILDYAGNPILPEGVIGHIANRKEAIRDYHLLTTLIFNPKLHLKRASRMIQYLRPNEIKKLSRSRNVSPQLRRMAKELSSKRDRRRQM